jgi:hypothetical protein
MLGVDPHQDIAAYVLHGSDPVLPREGHDHTPEEAVDSTPSEG